MKKYCTTFIVLLALTQSIFADIMSDAYQRYQEQNYKQAVELYKRAYELGEGISYGGLAAMWVGMLYEQGGYGIDRDIDKAILWYLKAINKSHYFAYGKLGNLYSAPNNPTQFNKKKAISCAKELTLKMPNNFISHRDAAEIYYQVGDYKRAVELQRMAIRFAKGVGVESKESMENAERNLEKYLGKMQQSLSP